MVDPHIVSVNVGHIGIIRPDMPDLRSGIVKRPVGGRILVTITGVQGDAQADPTMHGGPTKAVYLYPIEHKVFWETALQSHDLSPSLVGENLTIAGLLESDIQIGDRLRMGEVDLIVTMPRQPCYKLAAMMRNTQAPRYMMRSGFTGFYASVAVSGYVEAGAAIEVIGRAAKSVTIAEANRFTLQRHLRLTG
ncbi:MAG TPA: MOSC domain-containing protein [Candidatus Saccharimonadia bacterium]|nr:MOSC domain-containing protein [Candidatus Saccharimonadia bacterium]